MDHSMEGTSDKLATLVDLSAPDLTDEEMEAVLSVLRTRHLSLGPKLAEFEEAVAGYVGRRHGVAVNSGTSALHLIVRALGIGEGEEVITTPFSFIASSNCLLYERAVPRFVDIDPLTFNIDCNQVETAVTERTKALLAVDVFGLPADWDHLRRIADRHGLRLIDDSCEALGASRKLDGRGWVMAGCFGDAGTFAFYPNKQITTGEGGMIVTDDGDVAELCRSMRNQGRDSGAEWLRHARLGYNYRLSDINCALGIAQMSRIDQVLAARRRVAGWYEEMLGDIEGVVAPAETADTRRSWFVYVVRLAMCQSWQDLDEVVRRLRGRGIGCSNYFYPIHLQPFYREMFGYEEGDFPVTESTSKQTLALPFHNRLSRPSVARVVDALRTTLDELDLGG